MPEPTPAPLNEQHAAAEKLEHVYAGPAWHGPALLEVLRDVDANLAARYTGSAHSIWELIHHITSWNHIVARRLAGERLVDISSDQDFPPVTHSSAEAWQEALAWLAESHRTLKTAISNLPTDQLTKKVPGKDYDHSTMIWGVADHVLYHAGQIAVLKRL